MSMNNKIIIECETVNNAGKLMNILSYSDLFKSFNIIKSKIKLNRNQMIADNNMIIIDTETEHQSPIDFCKLITYYYDVKITLIYENDNVPYGGIMKFYNDEIIKDLNFIGNSRLDLDIKLSIDNDGNMDYDNVMDLIIGEYFSDTNVPESNLINDIIDLPIFLHNEMGIDMNTVEMILSHINGGNIIK